jgi:hypothetical protein
MHRLAILIGTALLLLSDALTHSATDIVENHATFNGIGHTQPGSNLLNSAIADFLINQAVGTTKLRPRLNKEYIAMSMSAFLPWNSYNPRNICFSK